MTKRGRKSVRPGLAVQLDQALEAAIAGDAPVRVSSGVASRCASQSNCVIYPAPSSRRAWPRSLPPRADQNRRRSAAVKRRTVKCPLRNVNYPSQPGQASVP
jgi:hypothetical protein